MRLSCLIKHGVGVVFAGLDFQIKVHYSGFNTTHYRRRGCGSSTCEAVEILKSLHVSSASLKSARRTF